MSGLSHIHDVYNTDERFVIDPSKRTITQTSGKSRLIRGDHNSECYAFEIPRYIDGHDMSECNSVRIHYANSATDRSGEAKGPYAVNDLMVDSSNNELVVFSWLLSRNTTKYAGTLNFSIVFRCLTNSIVEYEWNTDIFKGITVSDRIDNDGNEIVEDYVDVLEQWRDELFNGNSSSGLPEGDAPNMQLVTDAEGNVKWDERLGYTDWEYIEQSDVPVGIYNQGYDSLPFELFPVVGEEYTVTWDGTSYNCPATIITIDDENVTIIGSTTFFGGTIAPDIPVGICCRSGRATVYSNESGEHTIGVSGYVMNPVKIPREYVDWNPVVGVIDSSWYNYRYLNETRGASIAEIRKAAREKNKDIIIRLDLDNWQGTMRYLGLIDVSEDGETYLPALVFSTIKTNNASINVADETINGTMELEYWYTPLEPTEGPPANAFVNFQFGKINLKDAALNSETGDSTEDAVKSVDGILPDEDGNVQLNVENTGIKRVESLDKENLIQLRDLETGPYVLYGWFSPFPNSDISMVFDNTIVVVSRKDAGSHLLVLTGLNSKINFLEILVDETNEKGFTYTRTDYVMNDLYALLSRVDALEQPRNSIPMVDKETGTTYILEVSNGSLTMTEVTE